MRHKNLLSLIKNRTSKWKLKSEHLASKRFKPSLKRNYSKQKFYKKKLKNTCFQLKSSLTDPEKIKIREQRYKRLTDKFELYASLGRYKNPIGTHLLFFPTMLGTLSVLPLAQFLPGFNLVLSFECKSFCIYSTQISLFYFNVIPANYK